MKYLLFLGDTYYPKGGFHDLVGVFDTIEAAQAVLPVGQSGFDWAHIVEIGDGLQWQVVYHRP